MMEKRHAFSHQMRRGRGRPVEFWPLHWLKVIDEWHRLRALGRTKGGVRRAVARATNTPEATVKRMIGRWNRDQAKARRLCRLFGRAGCYQDLNAAAQSNLPLQ